jgi:hypothetical protein
VLEVAPPPGMRNMTLNTGRQLILFRASDMKFVRSLLL